MKAKRVIPLIMVLFLALWPVAVSANAPDFTPVEAPAKPGAFLGCATRTLNARSNRPDIRTVNVFEPQPQDERYYFTRPVGQWPDAQNPAKTVLTDRSTLGEIRPENCPGYPVQAPAPVQQQPTAAPAPTTQQGFGSLQLNITDAAKGQEGAKPIGQAAPQPQTQSATSWWQSRELRQTIDAFLSLIDWAVFILLSLIVVAIGVILGMFVLFFIAVRYNNRGKTTTEYAGMTARQMNTFLMGQNQQPQGDAQLVYSLLRLICGVYTMSTGRKPTIEAVENWMVSTGIPAHTHPSLIAALMAEDLLDEGIVPSPTPTAPATASAPAAVSVGPTQQPQPTVAVTEPSEMERLLPLVQASPDDHLNQVAVVAIVTSVKMAELLASVYETQQELRLLLLETAFSKLDLTRPQLSQLRRWMVTHAILDSDFHVSTATYNKLTGQAPATAEPIEPVAEAEPRVIVTPPPAQPAPIVIGDPATNGRHQDVTLTEEEAEVEEGGTTDTDAVDSDPDLDEEGEGPYRGSLDDDDETTAPAPEPVQEEDPFEQYLTSEQMTRYLWKAGHPDDAVRNGQGPWKVTNTFLARNVRSIPADMVLPVLQELARRNMINGQGYVTEKTWHEADEYLNPTPPAPQPTQRFTPAVVKDDEDEEVDTENMYHD